MGFFDLFRKNRIAPSELRIALGENTADINGKCVRMPCSLKVLVGILGKPRFFAGRAGNMNYTWDKLGVYCYVNSRSEVYCLAVKAHPDEIPAGFDPKCMFQGQLSICSRQCEELVQEGNDIEIGRERMLNGLSLFSTYVDMDNGDNGGCHGAYNGIEVQYHRETNGG